MTAEVALLNKNGVARAADSAVTISGARGQKIYNAANKLFALSKYEPVGVMVYDSAEYMSVPWETIIKVYRHQLGEKSFQSLHDYYRDLLAFLGTNDRLFGPQAQESYVRDLALRTFVRIRDEIRLGVDALTKTGESVDEAAVERLRSDIIQRNFDEVAKADFASGMDVDFEKVVTDTYGTLIGDMLRTVFEELPLSEAERQSLVTTVVSFLVRDKTPPGTTGVVVAGFGADEHFPSLYSAIVQARVAGKLKFSDDSSTIITSQMGAAVVPFAQTDAVRLFIEGIEPSHSRHATRIALEEMFGLKEDILASLALESEEERKSASELFEKMAADRWRAFNDRAKERRQRDYIAPLVDVIESLPKDELASVAEALVNITSLRRKVSMDAETVGGPIDVAVISKGDGLVWIRRKHYFRSELNPQFFENYFRGSTSGAANGGRTERG